MYYPYVRGKQFEMIALRSHLDILKSGKVIPLIEPVSAGASVMISLRQLVENRVKFILVTNPCCGQLAIDAGKLRSVVTLASQSPECILGLIIHGRTKITDVETFLKRWKDRWVSLIHTVELGSPNDLIRLCETRTRILNHIFIAGRCSQGYLRQFSQWDRILIEDGFNRQRAMKNADFTQDEFFSDLHMRYASEGYSGFGDYLIVGDNYSEQGGPARAVTIHLSYMRDNGQIWTRHFTSDQTTGTSDEAGKFLQALRKLVNFLRSNNGLFRGPAIDRFLDLFQRQFHPKLGTVKGIALEHHIELMASIV